MCLQRQAGARLHRPFGLKNLFSGEDVQMANKHIKDAQYHFRKLQIETTARYHFTPTRMAIMKKIITSVVKDAEKLKPSYTADGNVSCHSHLGKQVILK